MASRFFFSYFPQFHADPINDRAWGTGFTDWDLIKDLPDSERDAFTPFRGFYDPSSPDYLKTLCSQLNELPLTDVGLMVYHYHFDGVSALSGFEKQLLSQPNAGPPFFLCWANETWSKRWVGLPGEFLVEQHHKLDAGLVRAHAAYLARFFELPHYHRMNGRPLFMIYDAQASINLPQAVLMYREAFSLLGLNPFIGTCIGYPQPSEQLLPYDFGCEFQPRFFFNRRGSTGLARVAARLKARVPRLFEWLGGQRDRLRQLQGRRSYRYGDYLAAVDSGELERELRVIVGDKPLMRSVFLCWDNLPRYRNRSTRVSHDGLGSEALAVLGNLHSDFGLPLLINSWNEWSEGAALELGLAKHPLRHKFLMAILNRKV